MLYVADTDVAVSVFIKGYCVGCKYSLCPCGSSLCYHHWLMDLVLT